MSGGELAVILASVAVVVAVAVLGAVGVSLGRTLRELRRLLVEIRRDLSAAVQRIEAASGQVAGEVQRVGGLLDIAERVSDRADDLSRVTHRALLAPLNAVASLLRRGPSADARPEAPGRAGPAARRASWARRLTVYLLRSATGRPLPESPPASPPVGLSEQPGLVPAPLRPLPPAPRRAARSSIRCAPSPTRSPRRPSKPVEPATATARSSTFGPPGNTLGSRSCPRCRPPHLAPTPRAAPCPE